MQTVATHIRLIHPLASLPFSNRNQEAENGRWSCVFLYHSNSANERHPYKAQIQQWAMLAWRKRWGINSAGVEVDFLLKLHMHLSICIYWEERENARVHGGINGGQRTTFESQFSPFTMAVPGIKLLPGLAPVPFTHWGISRDQILVSLKYSSNTKNYTLRKPIYNCDWME